MPKLSAPIAAKPIKLLLIGDSGTGKTGALMSLAKAGYNLRIMDFDSGVDILESLARKEKPEVAERIIYETFTDKMKGVSGKILPVGIPQAFSNALNMLNQWKVKDPGGYDLGPVDTWGTDDILIIDSLTHMCNAAFRHTRALNNRLATAPHQADYGVAQESIENLLALLYSTSIKCNVIVISHVTYLGGEEGEAQPLRGLPMSLGKALSPKIGGYFNTICLAKVVGTGASAKRRLLTQPDGLIQLKNAAPLDLARELPLETGLAEVFRVLKLQSAPAPSETTPKSAVAPAAA